MKKIILMLVAMMALTATAKIYKITVKDGDIAGGELELLKATPVTVTKSESYGSYAIYSFKTSAVKAYYNVIWSGNAEESGCSYHHTHDRNNRILREEKDEG